MHANRFGLSARARNVPLRYVASGMDLEWGSELCLLAFFCEVCLVRVFGMRVVDERAVEPHSVAD